MSNAASESLEQQVRDCLPHLYDFIFLQQHPLVRLLVPEAAGDAHRVQLFRNLITEIIASLSPGTGSNPNARITRIYNILTLRYIDQQPIQYIMHRLNLSERQFYRDHARAIQTLSQMLAEHVSGTPGVLLPASMSVQSEIERVHRVSQPQQIHVEDFLERAITAIQGLVDRYDAQIDMDSTDRMLEISADPMVLRQAIIWLMCQLITQSPPGSQFRLSSWPDDQYYQFVFTAEGSHRASITIPPEQWETLLTFMNALEGTVVQKVSEVDAFDFLLRIPFKRSCLLIIDDNPDAITLFRRYLAGQPYQVVTAQGGQSAIQLAIETQPALIVLDVILPQQDGWEVLQQLKTHPDTRHIPVLICSVLNAHDLAMSVGADGFLRKPPDETGFLEMLSRFTRVNS